MNHTYCSIITILLCLYTNLSSGYRLRRFSDDSNVTKRESDFFPDWVPFKNKQGEELGEFVAVKKTKLRKRLAPPVNFLLRAVADGDDYYDKDQGGGDTEDYFEKKDWSDTNRAVESSNDKKDINNQSELIDIDGIKTVLNHKPPEKTDRESKRNRANKIYKTKPPQTTAPVSKIRKIEYDSDYEDNVGSNTDNEKPKIEVVEEKAKENEEEKRENEEKRAKILASVDKLKAQHAAEQNVLIEKAKEEEMFREEQQRFFTAVPSDKYGPQSESRLNAHVRSFLDDYDEKPDSDRYSDKYSEVHETTTVPTSSTSKRSKPTTRRTTTSPKARVTVETGKLSVFRNPQAYMIYDYSDTSEESLPTTTKRVITTTKRTAQTNTKAKKKTSPEPKESESREVLSMVPADSLDSNPDEPALFFPKPKKNKRIRRPTTTTTTQHTNADTYPASSEHQDATKSSFTDSVPSAADTAPSAVDSTPTSRAIYIDTDPESTSRQNVKAEKIKEEKKHEHSEHEKGQGREYKAHHEEDRGEHGKKEYEGLHKDKKSAKGHHDKEDHLGKYDDHGGFDKLHHDESSHVGEHEHVEEGKKHAQYEESGKHSKGHSTKGSHDIHKKEEYEKNVTFFEEEGDSGEIEKHGGFKEDKKHARRGEFNKGKSKSGHEARGRGETGKFQNGSHSGQSKNLKASSGHDQHGRHIAQKTESGSGAGQKHWIYHHGLPARTASLTVIDRRKDTIHPLHMLLG